MKTKNILVTIGLLILTNWPGASQHASKISSGEILQKGVLPQLELVDELQTFKVTTTHYNGDLFGNFLNKQQVCGTYTRGLSGGKVKWNNVTFSMSVSPDRNAGFPQPTPVNYMEDFTYTPGPDMVNQDKFAGFTEYSAYTKNLVWDMLGIEGFAWSAWNELKLNVPYSAEDFNGKVDLAGQGSFENKDIVLTWTGITKRNGELCAVIEYRTMNNPVEYSGDGMNMKGRSHYWGTIWVSLEDKQIEHAVLFEDVMMEMQLPGVAQKQILNATREISYEKVI